MVEAMLPRAACSFRGWRTVIALLADGALSAVGFTAVVRVFLDSGENFGARNSAKPR